MERTRHPGADAIASKGRLGAHKWLLARRISQLSILLLFLLGPWAGIWIVKGNLNASLTLELLPLTDPYVLSQTIFAGHVPEAAAISGALIVLVFYLLVGGRVYCSWLCPVNMVTDLAHWLRERLGIKGGSQPSRVTRYWVLGLTLVLAVMTASVAWELVNPVSMLHRGLVFGMGFAWTVVLAVFLLDLFVSRRAWCGHLCPVGAFYSLLGHVTPLRVSAVARQHCNDCMDCYAVCPEPQVIPPALKGADKGIGPVILSANCTNCARCIDVCCKDVFRFTWRFQNRSDGQAAKPSSHKMEVLS
jgi:ferredoxin-type protein NapH